MGQGAFWTSALTISDIWLRNSRDQLNLSMHNVIWSCVASPAQSPTLVKLERVSFGVGAWFLHSTVTLTRALVVPRSLGQFNLCWGRQFGSFSDRGNVATLSNNLYCLCQSVIVSDLHWALSDAHVYCVLLGPTNAVTKVLRRQEEAIFCSQTKLSGLDKLKDILSFNPAAEWIT